MPRPFDLAYPRFHTIAVQIILRKSRAVFATGKKTIATENHIDQSATPVFDAPTLRQAAGLGVLSAVFYLLFSYGGIRSPDSEVVFRTAEALATRGTFAVTTRISGLENFGLPAGLDGRYYSLFGPGQSLASVPFVEIGLLLNETKWYDRVPTLVPISHYVGGGILSYVRKEVPKDLAPHALRFITSIFNVIVSALCVSFFYLLIWALTRSPLATWCTSILFAFGSLNFPYAGTFFSEPLATLFVILSFSCLVWNEMYIAISVKQKHFNILCAGVFLGIATTVHITAALYTPFFFVYGLYTFFGSRRRFRDLMVPCGMFLAGLGLFLALLGYYNYVRFGNPLETGRTFDPSVEYATYVVPWSNMFELLFSSGKGVLWYCPAVIAGLFFWRRLHARYAAISFTILSSVVFRLAFIASRSDWHGGYSLGPRYLVMAFPLLLLPVGEFLAAAERKRTIRGFWLFFLFSLVCIGQQIYFSTGEIFFFFFTVNWTYISHGGNVLLHDDLYIDWDKSPLFYILEAHRGPFTLRLIPVSNYSVFWMCAALATVLLSLDYVRRLNKHLGRWH